MKMSRETRIKYVIAVAVEAAAVLLALSALGFWSETEWVVQLVNLGDAFTIVGLLSILIGGLIWASSEGAFDGLSYVGRNVFALLIPSLKAYKHVTYYDYVMAKRGKRPHGYAFLFFVGLGYFVIGVGFLIAFKIVVNQ